MNQVRLNELLKSKMINIPLYVLRIYKEFNLTVDEMVLLLFLYDKDGVVFDPKLISDSLNMKVIDVMKIVSSLSDKGLVNIVTKTNEAKVKEEVISLDGLFDKITLKMMEKMNNSKTDINIFDIIAEEFARKLTPMECEMVTSWKKNEYPDELIIAAIREASLNGVTSLRYIDKILYEWNKKGYKKKEDIKKIDKKEKVEIFDCDWLDSDEEL